MPWCNQCDRYLSPSTVRTDGTCPKCGWTVDSGEAAASAANPTTEPEEEPLPPVPWHLKLLLAAVLVYLLFRLYQGLEWIVG